MSNYLYNGVELPELPTWDKTTYPVAVISTVLDAASSMYAGAKYILTLGKTFLWLNGKCYVSAITGVYRYDGSAWVWHYGSGTTYNQDIIAEGFFEALWSRTDIPTADGGVYLAGSEPEAVGGGGDEGEGDDGTGGDGGDGSEGDGEDDGGGNDGDEEGGSGSGSQDESINTARRKGFISGFVTGLSVRGVFDRKTIAEDAEAQAVASAEVVGASFSLYNPETVRRHSFILGFIAGTNVKGILAKKKIEPEAAYYLYGTPSESGNVALAQGDGYTLYNGAVAPDINKVWTDKETYPMAAICVFPTITRLFIFPQYTVFESESTVAFLDCQEFTLNGTKWELTGSGDAGATFRRIYWTSVDLAENDNVYVATSEPIALASNEPVAYLYNGVKLPKLPEWDRVAYPYAVIYTRESSDGTVVYILEVYNAPLRLTLGNGGAVYLGAGSSGVYWGVSMYGYPWSGDGTNTFENYTGRQIAGPNIAGNFKYEVVWANGDIVHTDGTLYLAASEPIPVYE